MKTCEIEGCERKVLARGLCSPHYQKWWAHGDPRRQIYKRPAEERFWKFVARGAPDDCWMWTGTGKRYGFFWCDGDHKLAHRYSYELHKGPIPQGMFVMHTCDTPKCVNPVHLGIGTPLDNMSDMWGKGRAKPTGTPGERHYSAKLTEADVRFIRDHPEISHSELARRYGVDPNSIIFARKRKTWKHVP